MPGKKRECTRCHKLMRSDNLKNHMKICIGSDQFLPTDNIQDHSSNVLSVLKPTNPMTSSKRINDIINGKVRKVEPNVGAAVQSVDEKKGNSKDNLPYSKLKETVKSISGSSPTHFLPSDENGLKEKLRLLYYILLNTATKPQIIEIITELCHRGVINDVELECVCQSLENPPSEESSETSSVIRDR